MPDFEEIGLMRNLSSLRFLLLVAFLFALMPARAEEARPEATPAKSAGPGPASELPQDSVTQHTIQFNGKPLSYTATVGTLPLTGPKGEIAAKIFYVAYTAGGAGQRPITIAFNGGPGAAAAFLHLGALGPRIVPFQDNGASPVRPVKITDNPDSWLAFTDLVFIDPVGTGYSRASAGGTDAEKAYWGIDKDVDSIAEAVRLYLSRNGRELASIYLAGESYGGFRAAELAEKLLGMGLQVDGAIMISPALEFSLLHGDRYSILPPTFALPSLAAAHVEMREGAKAPLNIVHEAEEYARTTYLLHLADGLNQDDAVNASVSKFTGLKPAIVARHYGRVSTDLFLREYLRDSGRALSAYDATVSVPMPEPTDHPHYDPILDGAVSVLAPATAGYIAGELGFKTRLEYRLLNREISGHWDFGIKRQGYAGSVDSLERARVRNPLLKILIAHGYTDLVTPYSMTRYLLSQLRPLDGAAAPDLRLYEGGHMMYLRPASRAQLSTDVRSIYNGLGGH
jgi:carboxypeptidase C (cathepsin A)